MTPQETITELNSLRQNHEDSLNPKELKVISDIISFFESLKRSLEEQ